jgi:hypothetical protein
MAGRGHVRPFDWLNAERPSACLIDLLSSFLVAAQLPLSTLAV